MRKAEIDALVRAHRGRARPVAFFHVLRQPALDQDDHAFLSEHVDELGASDLLRWRARCEKGFSGTVIRQLALRAIADPAHFQHEVLDIPRLELDEPEWRELAFQVHGKVPASVYACILAHGGPRPTRAPAEFFFTHRRLDNPDLDPEDNPVHTRPAVPAEGRELHELSTRDIVVARIGGSLALEDDALLALAMDRARAGVEDWSFAALDFPELLRDAVLEKARLTLRGDERANLLGWLEANGVPRAALLPLALAPMPNGQVPFAVVFWLSRQLATRAAWDRFGLTTVSALMAQRAFAELGELVTVTWSDAGRGKSEPPRALLEAMQVAFALALLEMTRAALARGDEDRALAALSALACLDPPSRVSRAVHELGREVGPGGDVAALLAVNERLVKHGDARDASLEGVIAALHAIADASR